MPEVLRQIGDRNGLKFHIDWYQNTVMLSKGRNTFAASKAIKVIPEPVKASTPILQTAKLNQPAFTPASLPSGKSEAASAVSIPAQSKVFTPQIQPKSVVVPPVISQAPSLISLNVQSGSLRANIERLSKENGWNEPSWKDEYDYMLKSSYTVTGKTFAEAVTKLLLYNPTVVADVNTAERKIYVLEGKRK